jgi:hypothetical protein
MSKVLSHLIENERLQTVSPATLLHAFKLHVPGEEHPEQYVLAADGILKEVMGGISIDQVDASLYSSYVVASAVLVGKLDLEPGDTAVLMNGRVWRRL